MFLPTPMVKIRSPQVTPSGCGKYLSAKGEGGLGIECESREHSSRDSNVLLFVNWPLFLLLEVFLIE